ncbi:MAG: hypothetical protein AB8B91_09505 [Rubripirellula sp.]
MHRRDVVAQKWGKSLARESKGDTISLAMTGQPVVHKSKRVEMKFKRLHLAAAIAAVTVLPIGCGQSGGVAGRSTTVPTPASAPDAGEKFEQPVRLKAGEEFISTEAPGYACPTMADVDGDGSQDLVVGQFSNGNMMFCKNVAATDELPEFAKAKWIGSESGRAIVPGVW